MNRNHNLVQRSCRVLFGLLVTTLCSAPAAAAIIGTATKVRNPPAIPFSSPDAALGAPWVGYALDIQSTAGETIAAVDVSITGQLHQRWTDTDFDEVFEPTASSQNQSNGDSHLRAIPGALFANGPTEDNSGTGSPLADTNTADYGVGTRLRGAWGIPGALQTTSANLAYIVIPDGTEPQLDIRVKVANPLGDIIGDLNSLSFFLQPEFSPVVGDLEINGFSSLPIIQVTLPASDDRPIGELTWSLESFTPDPHFFSPTVNPATGLFTWNAAGSGLGRYDAVIRATDASGLSDTGRLTIWFPEPSTSLLLGSALFGFVCSARKRTCGRIHP